MVLCPRERHYNLANLSRGYRLSRELLQKFPLRALISRAIALFPSVTWLLSG